MAPPVHRIIPGSGRVFDFWITDKATGVEKPNTDYSVEATVRVGGGTQALPVTTKGGTRYSIAVGAGISVPFAGKRGLFRAWATPIAGVEAPAIEAVLEFGDP